MKKIIRTGSARATRQAGTTLARTLKAGTVVLLEGNLGSGKTTFVKGLAQGLGFKRPDEVKSPTFVLLHVYSGRRPLYHFDLYRLESHAELEELGFEEFLSDPKGICCIEWAEKARSGIPQAMTVRVGIEILGPQKRKIKIESGAAE